MENSDFFYVPDELDNKGDVKRLVVGILCVGLLFFIAYVIISYVGEFPITAYLSLYAVICTATTVFLVIKFLKAIRNKWWNLYFQNNLYFGMMLQLFFVASCKNPLVLQNLNNSNIFKCIA